MPGKKNGIYLNMREKRRRYLKVEKTEREGFKSRLGFLLVSAGCAIGIGNVWKFPYMVGQNGGAIFVILYLIFLVLMGIPVMTMELAVGRATRQTAVGAYKKLEKSGQKWHIHGWLCLVGCTLLMMFYTTVAGWMLAYAYKFAAGTFENISGDQIAGEFSNLLASPGSTVLFMGIVVGFGFAVLLGGVQKGLEKVTKIMMIGLLALILILAVNSMALSGAGEGINFYLLPNLQSILDIGIGNVVVAAMSQAFFTLSLGIGSQEVFGSYMDSEHSIFGESIQIALLDTFVAIVSGLIIFPACFSFGVSADQGPSLIFVTLPQVFTHMNSGRIWGTLFFVFMSFASLSSVIAVFENLVGIVIDSMKISRKKAIFICCAVMFILSLPCALGYNLLSGLHILGSRDILDSEDFLLSNIFLPLGALTFLLFCTTRFGWGFDNYFAEINKGDGLKMPRWLKPYLQFVVPLLILVIFITGLI